VPFGMLLVGLYLLFLIATKGIEIAEIKKLAKGVQGK
jgi:hypothetical protein